MSRRARNAIAKKEFTDIFKERTILVAVLIQVVVAGLSSFLVVGLSALTDPSAIPSRTAPDVAVSAPEDILQALEEAELSMTAYPGPNSTLAAFTGGRADAALIMEQHPDDGTQNGTTARFSLYLPDGDIRATLTLVHVKDALERYERTLRDGREARIAFDPIYVTTDVGSSSYEFAYALLIPLLVFLPVVLAGALTADSLTEEVQRDTLTLLLASPATAADVVEGKLLANVSIAPLLTVVWLGLLALNGLTVPPLGALLIVVLATAGAAVMCLIAAAAGLWSRDRNKAQVLYTQTMLLLIVASFLLPVSPVNAVALLAAGSATTMTYLLVAAAVGAALGGIAVLRLAMARAEAWLVGGDAAT